MLLRQKPELYGPWQLLLPVKQLTPLWVQVPHQGDVSVTPYAAWAQSSQSDWQVASVGLGVGLAVGLSPVDDAERKYQPVLLFPCAFATCPDVRAT